MIKFPIS